MESIENDCLVWNEIEKEKRKKKKKRGAFSVEHITLTAARGESTGLSGEEH